MVCRLQVERSIETNPNEAGSGGGEPLNVRNKILEMAAFLISF